MKKTIIATIILAFSASSMASNLSNQINAVAQAEQAAQSEQKALQAKQEAEALAQQQRQRNATAAANKAKAAATAKANAVRQEDKLRDQVYEDKLRDLEIRRQELALKAEEAKVNRVNDYIDKELSTTSDATDVVESEADVN